MALFVRFRFANVQTSAVSNDGPIFINAHSQRASSRVFVNKTLRVKFATTDSKMEKLSGEWWRKTVSDLTP